MLLPFYFVFQNGQPDEREAATFKLHDSRVEFEARPRVFTTFVADKSESGYTVRGLNRHIERLLGDAAAFDIIDAHQPLISKSWVEAQLEQLLSQLTDEQVIVRLLVSRDGFEIFADKHKPRWAPNASIALATWRGTRLSPEHKTTATEVCRASYEYALSQDAHEALLIDDSGCISEGSWSNFFWLDANGTIYTRRDGVLPGVTRQMILETFPVEFRTVTLEEFFQNATEAFITQSSQAVTPVARIDQWEMKKGSGTFFRAELFEGKLLNPSPKKGT